MKNIKKSLALLLSLALVLSLFAGLSVSAREPVDSGETKLPNELNDLGDPIFFLAEYNNGTYGVCAKWDKLEELTSVTIPAKIGGHPITVISESCFSGAVNLTSVTIPEGITKIERTAFVSCDSLTSLTLPASLTELEEEALMCQTLTSIQVAPGSKSFCSVDGVLFTKDMKKLVAFPGGRSAKIYTVPNGVQAIGAYAFEGCNYVENIVLPGSVTEFENNAFNSCFGLRSINLPDSLAAIPEGMFRSCWQMSEITIPRNVTGIGANAFEGCENLKVRIPDTVTELGQYALLEVADIYADPQNPVFCSVDGVLFSKDQRVLIQYPGGSEKTAYTVPDSVTEIAADAFEFSVNLQSIRLPDSLTTIGTDAFYCSSLKEVTIPAGITQLPDSAFQYCENLKKVTFLGTVSSVGRFAFAESGITSIDLPEGLAEIDDCAFVACPELTEIRLPDSLRSIGASAFELCEKLKSIDIPFGVVNIGNRAFQNCTALHSISIPATIGYIRDGTLYDCGALTDVTYGGKQQMWDDLLVGEGNDPLRSANIRCTGDVYADDLFLYVQQPGTDALCLYGVTEKAKHSGSLSIPAEVDGLPVRFIGTHVFSECQDLSNLVIPEGVEAIGPYAFCYCIYLRNVSLPSTLRYLMDYAFASCMGLGSISLPSDLHMLGDGVFMECYALRSLCIPEGVRKISYGLCANCPSLSEVVLPENAEDIGTYAFYNCSCLTSLDLPDSITNIDSYAFANCVSLRYIQLPEALESLNYGAFENCGSMRWVYMPADIYSIELPFQGCDAFTDLYFAGSPEQWEAANFYNPYSKISASIHYYSVPAVGDFYDVRESDWFCDSVAYAYEKGLMNGTGDCVFSPQGSLTRAQLVTILYRVAGEPEVSFKGTFSDVAAGKWFSDAVEWAAAEGIVNGYNDGTFKPNDPITREQIATILYRAEGSPAASGSLDFPDAGKVSNYAKDAMRWAVGEGLINGIKSGSVTNLAPKNTATRAQIAAIIMRYLEAKA